MMISDDMKGEILFNETLAPYTSWHIGGTADRYFRPATLLELQEFLKTLPATEKITWLGLGSNVLIADEGLRGTVIHTLGLKTEIEKTEAGLVRVEMGVPCAKVAKYCTKQELKGGAFFAGIPGTMGGALAMNAGAFGGETWTQLKKIEVMNRSGDIVFYSPEEYEIGYRKVRRKHGSETSAEWFVAGHFQFEKGNGEEAAAEIKQLLKKRNESQPIGVFSCGSVFTNPPGHYVGQLIEKLQLKGTKSGDAEISCKHANFIINHGNASAQDVLNLMRLIMENVYQEYKVVLQPEVRILGYQDPYFWLPEYLRKLFKEH